MISRNNWSSKEKVAKFHTVQRVLYFEKTALCNSSSLQYSICVLIVAVEIYYLIKIQEEKVTFQWELSVFPTWPKKMLDHFFLLLMEVIVLLSDDGEVYKRCLCHSNLYVFSL